MQGQALAPGAILGGHALGHLSRLRDAARGPQAHERRVGGGIGGILKLLARVPDVSEVETQGSEPEEHRHTQGHQDGDRASFPVWALALWQPHSGTHRKNVGRT